MIDPQDVATARAALGAQLAATRGVSGLIQKELAQKINYHRSSVANVETGRQNVPREFWVASDRVLGTGTALASGYDELEALIKRQRSEAAAAASDTRQGRVRQALMASQIPGDAVASRVSAPSPYRLTVSSAVHLDEILAHLREQWHALVRTDNLFGPRLALAGVRDQLTVIDALLRAVCDAPRDEIVRLGARYAESAACLYEECDDPRQAWYWLSRAMEWAYEADDRNLLAWTAYRRAHQATTIGDAAQAIGLARAARRDEGRLPAPMRAAIRVQEAQGHALNGEDVAAQRLLDEAHDWAAADTVGDARGGHGSFCTPSYIEIRRADCLTAVGQPRKAIDLYALALPTLPAVYQRDRAAGFSRLAVACVLDGQPERAASAAQVALPAARGAGSKRILREIHRVGAALEPHRRLASVGSLLDDLNRGEVA